MAAAGVIVHTSVFLFVIYLSLFGDGGGFLPPLSKGDIERGVKKMCVVVLLPTEDHKLLECVAEVSRIFDFESEHGQVPTPGDSADREASAPLERTATSTPVKMGILEDGFALDQQNHIENVAEIKKESSGKYSFLVFPPEKMDRSCLSSPLARKFSPRAETFSGPATKENLLEFINVKCNTFVSLEGGLNSEGLHRQSILENIFRMESVPSGITMATFHNSAVICKCDESNCNNQCLSEKMDQSGSTIYRDPSSPHSSQIGEEMTRQSKNQFHGKTRPHLPQCERIINPTRDEFVKDYLERSRPVIIENGATDWPAITKWTSEYLQQQYGSKKIHIKLAPDGVFEGVEPRELWEDYGSFRIPDGVRENLPYPDLVVVRPATQNLLFSDFQDMIRNFSLKSPTESTGTKPRVSAYLEYSSIPAYFPELEDDVEEPAFIKGFLDRRHLNIWLSDGNTLGKLHFDPFDNFLCQLRGRKELTLFEPHNNTRLYEAHIPEALLGFNPDTGEFRRKRLLDSTSMVMAPVDILQPDFQRFPAFAEARPLNCTIDEGDILFMPAFWWHEVQSRPNKEEGRNLAVNFWYEPFLTKEFPCPECRLDVNPHYRHLL